MISSTFGPLAVVGGGAMAEAIVRGGLAAGALSAASVLVCEPNADRRVLFEGLGTRVTSQPREIAATGWPILLAVKPQSFAEVCEQLGPHLRSSPYLAISILAGVPSASIQQGLGHMGRVVRVMPNTAAAIGASTSAVAAGPAATHADLEQTECLFRAIGTATRIDESLMDAATAVVGSGPAYVFYLAEAMIEGAIDAGFDRATANALVRGTIGGAAKLLAHAAATEASQLRAAVTSKGGTTAAAIDRFDAGDVARVVRQAVVAARNRATELAQLYTAKKA